MSSKTSSQLITAFVQTKQNMQLDMDKKRYTQFQQTIKTRAKKVKAQKQEKATFNQAIQLSQKFKKMTDHKLPIEEYQKLFHTNVATGLSKQVAAEKLLKDGPNKLSQKEGVHWSLLLIHQLISPMAVLLWAGSILCFIAYGLGGGDSNLYLAIIIVAIILLTGFMNFYQTLKSQSIMGSFKDFIPPETIVIRDGVEEVIDATKLVVGDVIRIQTGKKIPADVRIVQSQSMKVDNSSLTGETQLLARSTKSTDDNPLQTKNIAFFSTLCGEGTGRGVVFATGDRTFIGQIANLAASANTGEEQTPLQKQIKRFIIRLTIFSVIIGGVLFGLGFAIGYDAIINFVFAIGVITANVPQGLVIQITVGLTLTAQILAKRKVLVKFLDAVETLGSTSCICSDKTGTLTQNKMTASNIWFSGKLCKADNMQKKGPDFKYEYDIRDPGFISLQESAVVCSVAKFNRSIPSQRVNAINNDQSLSKQQKSTKLAQLEIEWQQNLKSMLYLDMPTTGDASESGLIKFFQPIEDILSIRKRYDVVKDNEEKEIRMPFNSTLKYAFSINQYQKPDSHYCLFMKGAPERIWERCSFIDFEGTAVPKDASWERKFTQANEEFGKNGERVLGFAKYHLPKDKFPRGYNFNLQNKQLLNGLVFVGVLSLADPPKDTVPYAVLKCRSAGVKVIMVTGDQPVTAASIAKQCNIISEETVNQIAKRTGRTFEECFSESNAVVIHGDMLTDMAVQDQGLPESEQGKKLQKWLSKSQIVFARTTPAQKLIIVKGCQRAGQVVAVTGDGVNDSPAIKKADIGVSMGITGTDVAKDAADMILLNDDFSSIVVGIEEGRKIYDNIKKAICYALTSQIGQMLPFIALMIFQIPTPLTSVLVLYISIGTDLIPAIGLAYQPGELDLMTRKPRHREDHMVTMTLMCQAYGYQGWTEFWGGMLCFYVVFNDFGFPPNELFMTANLNLVKSNPGDVYNPTDTYFGNTYLQANYKTICPESSASTNGPIVMVDWVTDLTGKYDLRNTMLKCQVVGGQSVYTQQINWGQCKIQQISPMTNLPVCYTTQAAKYAQTAYFLGVVWGQVLNFFVCKTRKLSAISQGVSNTFMFFSLTTQILLVLAITFVKGMNVAFGTRDNIFMHYGTAALPFCILQLLMDEARKYFIRTLPADETGKPHWFNRAALW